MSINVSGLGNLVTSNCSVPFSTAKNIGAGDLLVNVVFPIFSTPYTILVLSIIEMQKKFPTRKLVGNIYISK